MRESGNELIELERVGLNLSAISSIFPNLPKYFSKKQPPQCLLFLYNESTAHALECYLMLKKILDLSGSPSL